MEEAGDDIPPLPDNPAPYLTAWLFEIGPTSGDAALGWLDLQAWERISGVELLPFEAKILRRLSVEYANERFLARDDARPMPYNLAQEEIEARRDAVDAKLRKMFGMM